MITNKFFGIDFSSENYEQEDVFSLTKSESDFEKSLYFENLNFETLLQNDELIETESESKKILSHEKQTSKKEEKRKDKEEKPEKEDYIFVLDTNIYLQFFLRQNLETFASSSKRKKSNLHQFEDLKSEPNYSKQFSLFLKNFLQGIFFKKIPFVKIYIPFIILQELDQKKNGNDSKLSQAARKAVSWINFYSNYTKDNSDLDFKLTIMFQTSSIGKFIHLIFNL